TQQLNKLHGELLQSKLNKETQLVVLPETFIISEDGYDVDEERCKTSQEVNNAITLVKIHFPKASILTGANTSHDFTANEELTSTAKKYGNADKYYDSYNTAMYIDTVKN